MFIFRDTISSLDVGDELGLFDQSGILDASGNTGELLVGAGLWTGSQASIAAVGSVDLSAFGGPILPGAVQGNELLLKIWKASDEIEK